MNFEHKGKKYGISFHGGNYFFYSENMIKNKNARQIKLNVKTLSEAIKEVNRKINKTLK